MRSQATAPPNFSRPWQLFAWSLCGQPRLLAALAASLVGVLACEVAIPRLLAEAIDAALVEKNLIRLDFAGLGAVGVVLVLYCVHVLYIRYETKLLYDAILRVRGLLTRRILEQPLDFFARARAGALTHIVLNDTEVLETHGVYVFSDVPFATMSILAILGLMFYMDWQMALVVAGFLAAATVVSFRIGRPLPTLRKTIQSIAGRLSARLAEAVSGARTVKAFGQVSAECTRLDALNREVMGLEVREGLLSAWVEPLLELMELLGVVLIVWLGAHRVLDGAMTPGVLVAFIAYMELLSEPVSHAGRYVRYIQVSRGVMQRLVQFLADLAPPPVAGSAVGERRAPRIELRGVTYRYPGAERAALAQVTLDIPTGGFVALVGRNGAGKSTLVDLLLGFRMAQEGTVSVGTVSVADWEPGAWHQLIGLAPQEVFLFHASLADNIAYARPDASRQEIERAAREAGLQPLIGRLPGGLDTVVGDRGQKLSGGERQRVALARLLLNDPPIIVLDEPTAALDGEASRDIGRLVKGLSGSRTVVVIAHRAETVALADRVVLLDEGRVVFDGGLEEAHRQPLFRRLFPPAEEKSAPARAAKAR